MKFALYNVRFASALSVLAGLLLAPSVLAASFQSQRIDVQSLSGRTWKIAPQDDVTQDGARISMPGFQAARWVAAQVPGTVFGSYVNDGLEKEPSFGDNILTVDKSKYDRDYWYRTEFTAPASYRDGKVWLCLDGVNRDSDVYLNGRSIGATHGFMQRGRFDVTGLIHTGGRNCLAVLAYVPVLTDNGDSFSPSFLCSQGWDWMPRVPGLNMGIYKDVYLSHTGPVVLTDPWVRSDLPTLSLAALSVQVGVENRSSVPVTGTITGVINPGKIEFAQQVSLAAGQSKLVTMDSRSIATLRVKNPRLWWPNGYGKPNLYTCSLAFRAAGATSDAKTVTFGIRKYAYDTDGGILHFHINGIRVFPKGGNWGMSEFMLRCHGSDYDTRVRLHREMHFNMIRNWMGMTNDEAFYDACDRNGIMVWDDFWLFGDNPPADNDVFQSNAIEKIKQVRNHACVAVWCGSNEGVPAGPLNNWLRQDVARYDGGDRLYQPNSHAGNLSGSGPWNNLSLKQYFVTVPTGGNTEGQYGMRSEVGMATVTSLESAKKFIPKDDLWPRDMVWLHHYMGQSAGNAHPDEYNADIDSRYGEPGDAADYCSKAQFLNLEAMKAIFEGWLDHSDRDASGVLIWMSQSAFPSFVWQTYDYYYDLTGSYWGARSACEPVHIYWNANDDRVRVSNTSRDSYSNMTADAWIYNMDGSLKQHMTGHVSSGMGKVVDCFTLQYPDGLSPTHFIRLRLTDSSGKVVSVNFYWRGTKYQDYTALNDIKKVHLAVKSRTRHAGASDIITVSITNPGDSRTVAFGIRPTLVWSVTGEQVLPAFISDGYFALMPGETKTVTIEVPQAGFSRGTTHVDVDCWNNAPKYHPIPDSLNLALGRPATSSSDESTDHLATLLTDGSTTTRWASQPGVDPQWITVDLGETKTVDRVKLMWEAAFAKSFQIQVSDDKEHWTDIYRTATGKGGVQELSKLNGQGRYVRVYMTQRGSTYGYSLYEIKVYGADAALAAN